MMHRLATNYAKNYCNRTPIVKVIVENIVTFFGTQCTGKQNYPGSVAFYHTRPGNEVGLTRSGTGCFI